MKKVVMVVMLLVAALSFSTLALAAEEKITAVIQKIEMKSPTEAQVTLKDNKTGNVVVVTVTDELTLDKFKDKRIKADDEVRCKYDSTDGKNISKLFRKTAGC